ncbi:MAG: hypothetical protein HRU19_22695 [Pseudobacteriovorax sp.]|nr:hypothetical protein [Pseudobacteriovorax sp.]
MPIKHWVARFGLLLIVLSTGCSTTQNQRQVFEAAPGIPKRYGFAAKGTEFLKRIIRFNEYDRERAILKEARRGNIPNFLRSFKPIVIQHTLKTGIQVKAVVWVMPDYLSIGSDKDFVRMPMNPVTAQWIADHFGCVLPTVKLVDQIYAQADLKLTPIPFKPSSRMVTTHEFQRHHLTIQRQLGSWSKKNLVAGHKKDIVITNRLSRKRGKVAIYGWHRPNGKAIQPLSTIHGNYYADYSHGLRLVAGMMLVNNVFLPVAEVLQDPNLAPIISYEGALKSTRYATEGAIKRKFWAPER